MRAMWPPVSVVRDHLPSMFALESKWESESPFPRCARSSRQFGKPMQRMHDKGYYGEFGGRFVPEVLIAALGELEDGIRDAFEDGTFWHDYHRLLRDFVGRPSPILESS